MKFRVWKWTFAIAGWIALAVTGASGWSQARPKPIPAPAAPAVVTPSGQALEPAVMIRMLVLEYDQAGQDKVDASIKKHFPKLAQDPNSILTGVVDPDVTDQFARELREQDSVKIISRPHLIARSGKQSTVQVGQLVPLPPTEDPDDEETEEVGLVLECRPTVVEDGKQVRVQFRMRHSSVDPDQSIESKGVSYPMIRQREVSSALQIKDRETILLQGPVGRQSLMVLLTPTIVRQTTTTAPSKPDLRVQLPTARALAVQATSPSGLPKQMDRIRDAVSEIAPGALTSFTMDDDGFEFDVMLESATKISKLTELLSQLEGLKVKTIRVTKVGHGSRCQVSGEIRSLHAASPAVRSAVYAPRPLKVIPVAPAAANKPDADSLADLATTLGELFPDEKVQLRKLNQSVLIRGTVSAPSVSLISRVVEDYFPRVINHLEIKENEPAAAPVPKTSSKPSSDLSAEVRQLRSEVKAMRADVRAMIELIRNQQEPAADSTTSSPDQSDASVAKQGLANLDDFQRWDLSMEEAFQIAQANQADSSRRAGKIEKTQEELKDLVSRDLARLHLSWRDYDRIAPVAAKQWALDSTAANDSAWNLTLRSNERAVKQLKEAEGKLRKTLGLASPDQRIIRPIAP